MKAGALSGHVLSPLANGGVFADSDGLLVWDDRGMLVEPLEGPSAQRLAPDWLLIPGLIDAHVHLPQMRVRGRFQEALLPWLRQHIWPEEERFSERAYRAAVTAEFRAGLLTAGTTAALVYGAPGADSVHAVLQDLEPVWVRGGDVLMDRNGPESLLRDSGQALEDCREHLARYGTRYAITPRFAPTCGDELLAGCGRLMDESSATLQTHLAENVDELEWVAELFPSARSYTDVYRHFGLLGPRSVFGHCIHLDDLDIKALGETGSWIAHCPSSNVALGSGRMPLERILAGGLRFALATDVGAGPDLSMLDVMRLFLAVHRGHVELSPMDALRAATLFGAQALGQGAQRGALCPGRRADMVAVRIPGGLGRGESLISALGRVLQEFSGRYEEAVAAVWIGGRQWVAEGAILASVPAGAE
ncbi:MAG: guanine deaminase [Rickettsiales bacterium]|nr:guanine deaminase [Rickettsiales bacterium]|tara:strand:+ start:1709 stop:2965 length:1257 start_codon:yes stop_codon:yes gene_type:complete